MPRGKNPKVQLMAKVPLFSRCSKRDLERIAGLADEIDLPAGKVLMREGERGREFFVILDGSAEVRQKSRRLRSLAAGDFFGEIALVSDVPRTATVTAATPLRVLVITDRSFRDLLRRQPDIQGKVLAAVASRLAATL